MVYSSSLLRKRMTAKGRGEELFVCWSNGWFWVEKLSIGVQFLFASQKDDSDREWKNVQILRYSLRIKFIDNQ